MGDTKAGMKARKKSATFGFRAFVRNPCRYAPQSPVFFGSALSVGMKLPFSRNVLIPSQRRYAAPASFTAKNAFGLAASTAESPSATSVV